MKPFEADAFNNYLEQARRNSIAGIRNGHFSRSKNGTLISADLGNDEWAHPWQISTEWDGKQKLWIATVKPGTVNGIEVWADDAPITRGGTLAVKSWLYGARAPAALEDAAKDMDVRTAKVMLITPRITSTQQIAVGEFPGGRTIDITTTYNGTIFNQVKRYQLITAQEYMAETEPSEEDFFNGTASEPPFDSLTIATLYAIGPKGSDVDGSWSIHPQYFVFWNLAHASRMDRGTETAELKVSFETALAGGIGNADIREMSRADANLAERMRAWFAKTSSKGDFWTV